MSAPTLGATRWARAAALGVATLALAIGSHVSAGGALPSLTVLAFLAFPLAMVAVVMTGRRCGAPLLLGWMTVAQLALHHTLMAVTSPVPGDMSAQMSSASGSAMSDPATAQAIAQTMTQTMAAQAVSGWSLSMAATHLLATVVAALLLARCEQALWQLVSRLLPVLAAEPILTRWSALPAPALFVIPALAHSEMSGGLGLRGPPSRLAVAA